MAYFVNFHRLVYPARGMHMVRDVESLDLTLVIE